MEAVKPEAPAEKPVASTAITWDETGRTVVMRADFLGKQLHGDSVLMDAQGQVLLSTRYQHGKLDGEVLTHGQADEIVANPDVRRLYLGESFTL